MSIAFYVSLDSRPMLCFKPQRKSDLTLSLKEIISAILFGFVLADAS